MADEQSRKPELPGGPDARPAPFEGSGDKSPKQIEGDILSRRIAEDKARYERGFPVAGHDFRREHRERERGR